MASDPESKRLQEDEKRQKNWKRWGPYLSERQWGTVREDYSADGSCWSYFPHDHARSRAYRWGEDGLLGITDRECRLCFSPAFWNGKDPILKERLFGLTGPEGNNGEDVKECYYYLESLPTHSYMKGLYKYPQAEFPYAQLGEESRSRPRGEPEFELIDSGVFDENRYFDIFIEYAKAGPNDILIRLSIHNRSPEPAPISVVPQIWFRNSWSWGRSGEGYTTKPTIALRDGQIVTEHATLESFSFEVDDTSATSIFTENETNMSRLFGIDDGAKYVKDAFHEYVVQGNKDAVNPGLVGTKAGFSLAREVAPGGVWTINARLYSLKESTGGFGDDFDEVFDARIKETEKFYATKVSKDLTKEEKEVMRGAYAGLLWTKQFYFYSVREWLEGDPTQPTPDPSRKNVRNTDWGHLYNRDVISMPDKWEYPWYAAWDSAFHMITFARVDPDFAKKQLILFLREWYMHPNGQIPAYEFAFSDVNPPVHAWACWRVYKMTGVRGKRDRTFLARVFHKLLLNFTWWVNRKDLKGNNLFSGGFLGLDNIGVFDRSAPLPLGDHLEQADATAWMAFYCATMLAMALELASVDPAYGDVASKFFEHFIGITDAINRFGGTGLWDQLDGFYYDQLYNEDNATPLRVRSLIGIIPLLAVEVLEDSVMSKLPGFQKRMEWFLSHRPDLAEHISYSGGQEADAIRLLAVPSRQQLERVIRHVLDEEEFLSPYGIRSLSKVHKASPYILTVEEQEYRVDYAPGESDTVFFGGNSNWRGPVWFPLNYLFIEALERYHHFFGDTFTVEFPSHSGNRVNLKTVAELLAARLTKLFLPGEDGNRPCHGGDTRYRDDPHWKDLVLYYEFFHGETGRGIGASHQTGWTALVTRCLEKVASARRASE